MSLCTFQACCQWSVLEWTRWEGWTWAARWTPCSSLLCVACRKAINLLLPTWPETQPCGRVGTSLSLPPFCLMTTTYRWDYQSIHFFTICFKPRSIAQYLCITHIRASFGPRVYLWCWLIHNSDPEKLVQILLKVTRVSGSTESLSSLRVSQRLPAHHSGGSEMGFYRLSMSIECAAILSSPAGVVLPVASSSLSPCSGSVMLYTVCSCWAQERLGKKLTL